MSRQARARLEAYARGEGGAEVLTPPQVYREVILQLAADKMGFCVDASCPKCKYPEMGALIDLEPLIFLCRNCGHAQRVRPAP